MKGRPKTGLLVLLALVGVIALPSGAADAALPTCGSQDNIFSGRGYDPSGYQPRGAEAEMDIKAGVLCAGGNGPDTFFTSWVMIANQQSTGYAQVGHMFKNFGTVNHRFFYEYDVDTTVSGFTRVFWGNPIFGDHWNFKASRSTNDSHIHFTVEGNNPPDTVPGATPFDPLDVWGGTIAWWSSEVDHPGSDVPGTPVNKTNFDRVLHKDSAENFILQIWNLSAAPTRCYYPVHEVTPDSHFTSWTSDPDHNTPC